MGQTTVGDAIVFSDVTQIERQRRQIQQQNDQFDDFAEAITHELRNALQILDGHIEIVRSQETLGANQSTTNSLDAAGRMTDRMTRLVSDLTTLARFGHATEKLTAVDCDTVARQAIVSVSGEEVELTVNAGTIEADKARLERLFEKLFRFSIENGGTHIEVTQTSNQLTVTDDSDYIDEENIEKAFSYGQAVPDAETGMLLPVVRTLTEAHGWSITIDSNYEDGVRIIITMG